MTSFLGKDHVWPVLGAHVMCSMQLTSAFWLVPVLESQSQASCAVCRAYDRAAVKMRGNRAQLNFPDTDYSTDSFMKVRHTSAQLHHTSRYTGITAAMLFPPATEEKASTACLVCL